MVPPVLELLILPEEARFLFLWGILVSVGFSLVRRFLSAGHLKSEPGILNYQVLKWWRHLHCLDYCCTHKGSVWGNPLQRGLIMNPRLFTSGHGRGGAKKTPGAGFRMTSTLDYVPRKARQECTIILGVLRVGKSETPYIL